MKLWKTFGARKYSSVYELFENPTVIQKYGGTSLGDVERIRHVAKRIQETYDSGVKNLAIVVSAMAGETNRLVELVAEVSSNTRPSVVDVAVSAGEQVSVALLSAALEGLGLKAEPLMGFQLGVLTTDSFEKARIRKIDTEKLKQAWAKDCIPVVAGFQGVTDCGYITTLGRGGSDTSAVAVAVAVGADFCEINTDVDGFFSADPRVVNDAKIIPKLDFEVALEMASLGSKVLHTRSVELAAKFKMPLVVRNTFKDNTSQRTIVMNSSESEVLESPVVSGVSSVKNIAKITVSGPSHQAELISRLFQQINDCAINVDIIVHDRLDDEERVKLGFTVEESEFLRVLEVIDALKQTERLAQLEVKSESNLAKVSVVGLGMKNHHGVAYKVFDTLNTNGIDIKMISTSEIKISCVVRSEDCDLAVIGLHKAFIG